MLLTSVLQICNHESHPTGLAPAATWTDAPPQYPASSKISSIYSSKYRKRSSKISSKNQERSSKISDSIHFVRAKYRCLQATTRYLEEKLEDCGREASPKILEEKHQSKWLRKCERCSAPCYEERRGRTSYHTRRHACLYAALHIMYYLSIYTHTYT